MSDPTYQYLLCLARLDEDGAISESFLEAAAPSFPRVSSEAPLDEEMARSILMAAAGRFEGFCGYLQAVAEVMPASENQEAMFDDRVPLNAVTNMEGVVDSVVREYLRPATELLRRATIVTDEDLQRDFEERHAEYRRYRESHESGQGQCSDSPTKSHPSRKKT